MTWITVPPELVRREDERGDDPDGFVDWRMRQRPAGLSPMSVASVPGLVEDPRLPPKAPPTDPHWPKPGDGTTAWEILWGENRRHGAFLEATTSALKALLGLETELEANPEPSLSERRYRSGLEKIATQHGAKLDDAARRRFRKELDGVASARLPDLIARSRQRELNGWKERLDDSLVALREAALTSGSGRAERLILNQILDRIDLAAGLGLLPDATQGQAQFLAAYRAERQRRTVEAEAANGAVQSDEVAGTSLDADNALPEGEETVGGTPAAQQAAQATDGRSSSATARASATATSIDQELTRRRQLKTALPDQAEPDNATGRGPDDPPIDIPPDKAQLPTLRSNWKNLDEAYSRLVAGDIAERTAFLRVIAREGGLKMDRSDPKNPAFAGITRATLADYRARHRTDPAADGMPSTLEGLEALAKQSGDGPTRAAGCMAAIYKDYFDDNLRRAPDGAERVKRLGSDLSLVIKDMLVRNGLRGTSENLKDAVTEIGEASPARLRENIKTTLSNEDKPGMFDKALDAAQQLVDAGLGKSLCNAIAEVRTDKNPKEKNRHDHFRCP